MGQVPDPGFVYEKPLGPDVLSAALALSRLPPGIRAAIAGAAKSLGKPAIPAAPAAPDTQLPNALPGPVPAPLMGQDPSSYGVPPGWEPELTKNGKGVFWQDPGSQGNENTIRIQLPTPRYPNGYARFTNKYGQPVDLNGKPGSPPDTHIPIGPDGSFPLPKGWPAK